MFIQRNKGLLNSDILCQARAEGVEQSNKGSEILFMLTTACIDK